MKRQYFFIALILSVIAVEAGAIFVRSTRSPLSLQAYADQVLAKCKGEGYRPSCYDREVPKLMAYISMEDAFKVTSLVQDKDPSYTYCHVLGHKLSAQEVDKDPSKWEEVLTRCPSGVCSNGCLHGGLQERFRSDRLTDAQAEALKPDLANLCEKHGNWDPTGLEQASCYHALGHLAMYITNADIKKSTGLCKELTIKSDGRDFSHLCFDGAFMQIFQPLEPEDFALIRGKEVQKSELESFCAEFSGTKKSSCWTEGWPLFRAELEKPEGLIAYCAKAEPQERSRCYSAIIYVITAQSGLDENKMYNYCKPLPEGVTELCFANAASRMIEVDYRNAHKASALCARGTASVEKACFKELLFYSTYNFHPGSDAFAALCNSLPVPWKGKCLNGDVARSGG